MKKWLVLFRTEAVLYCRDVFSAFFTFAFPVLMLVLFGSIYGNAPTAYFDGLGSIDVSVPAYCAMILAVVGIMAFPLTLAQYKERKIYKRFDATPLGKGAVIAVQGAVSFTMAVLGFLLLFAVGFGVYGLRVDGSWVLIAALLLLCMASIFALGFFFTAIAPTESMARAASPLTPEAAWLCLSSRMAQSTVTGITRSISLVRLRMAAIAMAPKATCERPSPIKEKRFSTKITPRSEEHRAMRIAAIKAYLTKG